MMRGMKKGISVFLSVLLLSAATPVCGASQELGEPGGGGAGKLVPLERMERFGGAGYVIDEDGYIWEIGDGTAEGVTYKAERRTEFGPVLDSAVSEMSAEAAFTTPKGELWHYTEFPDVVTEPITDFEGMTIKQLSRQFCALADGGKLYRTDGTLIDTGVAEAMDCRGAWDGASYIKENGEGWICVSALAFDNSLPAALQAKVADNVKWIDSGSGWDTDAQDCCGYYIDSTDVLWKYIIHQEKISGPSGTSPDPDKPAEVAEGRTRIADAVRCYKSAVNGNGDSLGYYITLSGELYLWNGQTSVFLDSDVQDVTSYGILKTNGTVWTSSAPDFFGGVSLDGELTKVLDGVAVLSDASLMEFGPYAIKEDGTVWGWNTETLETAQVMCAEGQGGGTPTDIEERVMSDEPIILYVGERVKLKPDGVLAGVDPSVLQWAESQADEAVSVSQGGIITGVKPGWMNCSVEDQSGNQEWCLVIVYPSNAEKKTPRLVIDSLTVGGVSVTNWTEVTDAAGDRNVYLDWTDDVNVQEAEVTVGAHAEDLPPGLTEAQYDDFYFTIRYWEGSLSNAYTRGSTALASDESGVSQPVSGTAAALYYDPHRNDLDGNPIKKDTALVSVTVELESKPVSSPGGGASGSGGFGFPFECVNFYLGKKSEYKDVTIGGRSPKVVKTELVGEEEKQVLQIQTNVKNKNTRSKKIQMMVAIYKVDEYGNDDGLLRTEMKEITLAPSQEVLLVSPEFTWTVGKTRYSVIVLNEEGAPICKAERSSAYSN